MCKTRGPIFSLHISILFSLCHGTSIVLGLMAYYLTIGCKTQNKDKVYIYIYHLQSWSWINAVVRYFEESVSGFMYMERRVCMNMGTGEICSLLPSIRFPLVMVKIVCISFGEMPHLMILCHEMRPNLLF